MAYDQTKEVNNSNGVWEFKNDKDNIKKNDICAQERKIVSSSRKIKPIQNPALKLKTPIAYQRDSDPNMLPIEKEGRGKHILIITYSLYNSKIYILNFDRILILYNYWNSIKILFLKNVYKIFTFWIYSYLS